MTLDERSGRELGERDEADDLGPAPVVPVGPTAGDSQAEVQEAEGLRPTEIERHAPGVETGDLGRVSDETEKTPGLGGR